MKRFSHILLSVCIASTMCTACAPGPYVDPAGCLLVELESRNTLYLNPPGVLAKISGIMPQDPQWVEAYNIRDIEDYMYNQICEHLDKPNVQEGHGYVYGTLTDVNIIADCEIGGRDSGENLADLFEYKLSSPLFLYPSGEMVEYCNWQNPTTKTYAEFLDKNCFLPLDILLTDNALDTEGYETILLTISLTITDGTNEKTLTSSCSLEL